MKFAAPIVCFLFVSFAKALNMMDRREAFKARTQNSRYGWKLKSKTLKENSTRKEMISESALMELHSSNKNEHLEATFNARMQAVLAKASVVCSHNFWQTLRTCVKPFIDETTFVRTGDIAHMWTRDSAAQLHPYIPLAPESVEFQKLLEGALRSQAKFIAIDPYANAYHETWKGNDFRLLRGGYVATANHELDSGAYFLRFLKTYTDAVPTSNLLKEPQMHEAAQALLKLWRVEQNHNISLYSYPMAPPYELPDGHGSRSARGSPVGYTGMVWNGFRPSDDPHKYGYHIPANLFLATYLPFLETMAKNVWKDSKLADETMKLKSDILKGVAKYGTTEVNGKKVYCYEVDGLGNCNLMDDANVPSLLSIPYLDPSGAHYDSEVYKNTRGFVLSSGNPFFYQGKAASGIGSPHTPQGYIWPMSLVIEAMTTDDKKRKMELIQTVVATANAKDTYLHESFSKDDPRIVTRGWFAWPNALFAELVQSTGNSCGKVEDAPMPELARRKKGEDNFYEADVKSLRAREIAQLDLMKDWS